MRTADVLRNNTFDTLYRIPCCRVEDISNIPHLLQKVTGFKPSYKNTLGQIVPPYVNKESERQTNLSNTDIISLRDRLHRLEKSVCAYGHLHIFWKIIGIFSGTFWKYRSLRQTLPQVIQAVNVIATKVLEVQNKNDAPKAEAKKLDDSAIAAAEARKIQEELALRKQQDAEIARETQLAKQKALVEQHLAQQKNRAAQLYAQQKALAENQLAKLKTLEDQLAKKTAEVKETSLQVAHAKSHVQESNASAKVNVPSLDPAINERARKANEDYQAALEVAAKALAAEEKAKEAVIKAKAAIEDVQDEAAIQKGDVIRVNESNLPITPLEMIHKKALVARVISNIDNYVASYDTSNLPVEAIDPNAPPETPPYPIEVAKKIQLYVKTLFAKLCQNKNVPLPRWSHATGKGGDPYGDVTAILKTGSLHQLMAGRGYGTFFSSLDEHNNQNSYGLHTLFFDEGAFSSEVLNPVPAGKKSAPNKTTEVHYFPGDQQATHTVNRNTSLWLRVRCLDNSVIDKAANGSYVERINCVPANTNTVACMCTVAKDVAKLRKTLNDLNFKVSVLDRTEVDFIRFVFDAAETQQLAHKRHDAQEQAELTGHKKQESLVKFRNKETGQLVYTGGRHIPLDWKPHEHRENFHLGFPRHMGQLAYLANNPRAELSATFAEV